MPSASAPTLGPWLGLLPTDVAARVVQNLSPVEIFRFRLVCRAAADLVLDNPLCWHLHLPPSTLPVSAPSSPLSSPQPHLPHSLARSVAQAPLNRPYQPPGRGYKLAFIRDPKDPRAGSGGGLRMIVPPGNDGVAHLGDGETANQYWERISAAEGDEGGGPEWLLLRKVCWLDWSSRITVPRGRYVLSVHLGSHRVLMGLHYLSPLLRSRGMLNIHVLSGGELVNSLTWEVGAEPGFRRLDLSGLSVLSEEAELSVRVFIHTNTWKRGMTFGAVEAVRIGPANGENETETRWRSYRDPELEATSLRHTVY